MTVLVSRPFRFTERAMDRAVRLFHTCSVRLDTITDYLREGLAMRVVCKCGRRSELAAGPLVADCYKHGRSPRISQIAKRLTCAECGARPVDWGPA